jgi:hypothetical protein
MRSMPWPPPAVSLRAADVPAVGYDPARLAVLRTHTVAAIESLRWLTSDDPAAWEAVLAARVTREHLEQIWMPLIDRIIGSEAMVTWQGADLGEELADVAREILARYDTDDMEALSWALVTHGGDRLAMRTFFTELGGKATAQLLMELGVADPYRDPDAVRGLAAAVRDNLARATHGPGVPAGFAPELIEAIVAGYDDMRVNPAETLSFVLHDADFSGDFIVAVTKAVVGHERAAAADNPGPDHLPWPFVTWSSRVVATFSDDVDETGSSPTQRAGDPMYELMEALARDSEAARAVFTDAPVARYLLAERRFDLDGLVRLAAAAESAAAGPDVGPDAPAPLLKDAALVASAFVNHMGSRPDLLDDHLAPAVSESAAAILGRHMFAVHTAVLDERNHDAPGTAALRLDAFGPDFEAETALFDKDALARVTDLAVDTDEGLTRMRAALEAYHQGYVAAAAEASTLPVLEDPDRFLDGAVRHLGRLEAYLIEHAGHRAEAEGRDRDRTIRRWIDVVSGGLSGLGKVVPVLGVDLDGPANDIKERWATNEAKREREFEDYAEAATDRLTYVWYRELSAAGAITPDLPAAALTSDGALLPWDDFQRLDGDVQATVTNQMEENVWRGRIDIDGTVLADAIKSAQQDIYADLE